MKNCQEKCVLEAVKSVAEAEAVMNALNEENMYGDGDLADFTFVEMNETTNMFFNSMLEDTTCVEQASDVIQGHRTTSKMPIRRSPMPFGSVFHAFLRSRRNESNRNQEDREVFFRGWRRREKSA